MSYLDTVIDKYTFDSQPERPSRIPKNVGRWNFWYTKTKKQCIRETPKEKN